MRVLTYNIRSGTDILGRPRLAEQARTVRDAAPDIVLLQEVRQPGQAEQLAQVAGLGYVIFGPTRRVRAGEFGNAILSRWPLIEVEQHQVPRARMALEARAVLAATVVRGARRVRVIGTHFGLLPGEPEASAQTLLAVVAATGDPVIVGGDFNRPLASAPCHRLLRAQLVDCARHGDRPAQATFPSPAPVLRLDYVYVRQLDIQQTQVLASRASDHRPLLADLS